MWSQLGWVVEVKIFLKTKLKRSFLLFVLFIYFAFQRLIEEPGKLSINPLPKLTFFSMINRSKKERLIDVLTKLGCGQNQRYLFHYFFINIFILFI